MFGAGGTKHFCLQCEGNNGKCNQTAFYSTEVKTNNRSDNTSVILIAV